ncbi:hypothetical protein QA942_39755 [Streptomyces sp. B21-106]|uniref:hypothetical protein n=1 Tax=Streptomyces sp. B21-106 TaxID=3039418 RepID=UPI002FF0B64B
MSHQTQKPPAIGGGLLGLATLRTVNPAEGTVSSNSAFDRADGAVCHCCGHISPHPPGDGFDLG